jgi:hypothetical protein
MSPKDAFHQTVHEAPGGCEALAVRIGMSVAVLRNKANPVANFNKPTLDDVERIMGVTGDIRVLQALAANHNRVLVEVADGATGSDMAVLEMVTAVWSTNGEVGAEVNQALLDGRITLDEVERVHDAVKRAEHALESVVARLRAMAEPRRGGAAS